MILPRARKNDPIDLAQHAPLHQINDEKLKEKDSKRIWKDNIEQVGKPENEKDGKETENLGSCEDGSEDGHTSNTNCYQDSDISFINDTDKEIDTAVIEEEDWIEYIRRSTDEAMKQMKITKIQYWIKTHRRMNWRLATRSASVPCRSNSESSCMEF